MFQSGETCAVYAERAAGLEVVGIQDCLLLSPMIYIQSSYIFMEHRVRVAKWGNSLAIRIPASVVEALKLKEGDDIEVNLLGMRELGIGRAPSREDVLKRLRAFRGRLPAGFRFDRDDANGR